jgi:hypothetical protein
MEFSYFYSLMIGNAERIKAMAMGVSPEQARWKPDPSSWSILEVINHLYDEEREDFRVRLDYILHHPDQEWPPIDPEGWVVERRYNERELESSLEGFLEERRASLEWLQSLGSVDWDTELISDFGSMTAGDMFASWVTHDQLHLRQLVELHRDYTKIQARPYQIEYAGPW